MATIFTDILKTISKSLRDRKDHQRRTFNWYRKNAAAVRKEARGISKDDPRVDPKAIMTGNPERLSKRKVFAKNMIGQMFCFYYDPKHKKKLPYYDTFPLVFPIDMMDDGRLLAINLHYINPIMRATLMNRLYSLMEDEPDGDKRIGLSYAILKSAAQYKFFKPCLKSYLISHVRSRFMKIDPTEWDAAISLPTARFEKASEAEVWQKSLDAIRDSDEPRKAKKT